MVITKSQKILLSAGLLILTLILILFLQNQPKQSDNDNTTNPNTSNPTDSQATKISGTPLGILITDPNLKATISSPVLIKGSASADNFPDNQISFTIIDSENQVLGEGQTKRGDKQDNDYFSFETKLDFKTNNPGLGFIMINNNPNFKFPIQF